MRPPGGNRPTYVKLELRAFDGSLVIHRVRHTDVLMLVSGFEEVGTTEETEEVTD